MECNLIDLLFLKHAEIRSIAQALGALMAAVMGPMALRLSWRRTSEISRQNDLTAKAQDYQADRERQNMVSDNYILGMKELSQEDVYRRQSAIVILGSVGQDLDFSKPAFSAISAFIRENTKHFHLNQKQNETFTDKTDFGTALGGDIISAIEQIKSRKLDCPDVEVYKHAFNLSNSYIPHSNLSNADFRFCNLEGINLSQSNCLFCDFYGSNLDGATLEEANFKKANFSMASLKGANLKKANLKKVKLLDADISNADFRNVQISRLTILRNYGDGKAEERLRLINHFLPKTIKFGESYHPIQTAKWELKCPPIVDSDLQKLVDEKTRQIKKEKEFSDN